MDVNLIVILLVEYVYAPSLDEHFSRTLNNILSEINCHCTFDHPPFIIKESLTLNLKL